MTTAPTAPRARQTVTVVPLEQLTAHPGNIRDDLGDLEDLARSIREVGILQPLTVTEHPDGGYLLIAGHRRLSAALLAGWAHVPVVIRHGVDNLDDQLVLMLIENTHRRDLNPVERAQAYGALRNRGLTLNEIARRTGSRPSTVSYYLNLLDLDRDSLEQVRTGKIASTVAIAAVRDLRQAQRVDDGKAVRGRPKTKTWRGYFGRDHRLARVVRAACTHRDRPVIGESGCGICWEQAIRSEEPAAAAAAAAAADVDHVVVERFLNGDYDVETTRHERVAIVKAWAAAGRALNDLERLAGWNPQRYFKLADEQVA